MTHAMTMTPASLVRPEHPLNGVFEKSCRSRGVEPTRRQASKWLASPEARRYATVKVA